MPVVRFNPILCCLIPRSTPLFSDILKRKDNFVLKKEKHGIWNVLGKMAYVLSCMLFAVLLVIAVAVFVRTWRLETGSGGRIGLHYYLAAGFVGFFVAFLFPRFRSNFRWLMKFTHEFTHLFFAVLFFRKIKRFNVDSEGSYVSYAFHICCWVKQTRLHQTDIAGPGIVLSLLIITTFHIVNFCLIILTPSRGVVLVIQRVFSYFPSDFILGLLR